MIRGVLLFFVGGILGVALTIISVRQSRMARGGGSDPALEVNGKVITNDRYIARLRARYGGSVLTELMQQQLVLQKAQKAGLELTAEEVSKMEARFKSLIDPDVKEYAVAQATSQLLLRKLMLKDVADTQKRRIYDLFKEELIQYELSVIAISTEADARTAWKRLQEGLLTFDQVTQTYSLDPKGGNLGFLDRGQIERTLGGGPATAIATAKANSVIAPMYCSQGVMIIRLGRVLRTYEELQPFIENIIIESRRAAFARGLANGAQVSSPYLDLSHAGRNAGAAPAPSASSHPSSEPSKLDKPKLPLESSPVDALPRPDLSSSPAPYSEMPKPGSATPVPGLQLTPE